MRAAQLGIRQRVTIKSITISQGCFCCRERRNRWTARPCWQLIATNTCKQSTVTRRKDVQCVMVQCVMVHCVGWCSVLDGAHSKQRASTWPIARMCGSAIPVPHTKWSPSPCNLTTVCHKRIHASFIHIRDKIAAENCAVIYTKGIDHWLLATLVQKSMKVSEYSALTVCLVVTRTHTCESTVIIRIFSSIGSHLIESASASGGSHGRDGLTCEEC